MRLRGWHVRRRVVWATRTFALVAMALGSGAASAGASMWSLETVPLPPAATEGGFLQGASCTATNACTAVGTYQFSGTELPLAEGWDGTQWSVQSTPPINTSQSGFGGVSCVSAGWCMAVGYNSPTGSPLTLAEVWNGTGWTIVPSPSPGDNGGDAFILSVSCVSASACMAVGDYIGGGVDIPLAERWDGSSWTVVPVPEPPGAGLGRLFGVSCTAASACTAVGVVQDPATVPLIERWNGAAWSIQPSPDPNLTGSSESGFHAVSCVSTSACTAVGSVAPTVSSSLTLVERWDGSSWSIQPSPNPGTANDDLRGVSCPALSACSAVGLQISGSSPEMPLAEGWDGISWAAQSTPAPSSATSLLFAVSCLAVSWCQAVGSSTPTAGGWNAPVAEVYAAGASPSISTRASAGVPFGGQVHDTATLTGGQTPSGWIVFKLYAPGDTSCSLARAFTSRVPVHGDGTYTSGSFTPTMAGIYRFTATYVGDQNNNPATGACGTRGEQVTVAKATPSLTTTASGPVTLGGEVHDTATLAGGHAPTGTITFRLYRPSDTTCSIAPVFKSTVTVTHDGNYPSASFTPTAPGTYSFTAVYSGDPNNTAVISGCSATGEQVTVT